ncbi:MAG: PAS domain S-box protein, partial [Actinomycetota bacterium]|nr:PAS domain S-box protein [Actinomycetota bacterium]
MERSDLRNLEAVLETAHEAFVSIDEDGRVRAWNREAERTFGWSKRAVLGRILRDLIIPERYRPRHDAGLQRFLETGEGPLLDKRIEITALHRSGHEFPVELTISALREDGRWSFNAFIHDISDRYRASEWQRRLASVVEHSADAIISRTTDGRITSWNRAAETLFGYSADEMIGETVERIVPSDREGESARLLHCVVEGNAV